MIGTSLVDAMMLGLTIGLPGPALAQGDDRDAETMIQRTIIVYPENISFDHYCGTFGHGSAGIPAGVQLFHTTPIGAQLGPYAPVRLDGRTQAATCDVDHEYWAMDRYLQGGNNLTEPNPSTPSTCPSFEANPAGSALALAYYAGTSGDASAPLQNYWRLASQYTLADNFFSGMYGPSTPNAEWLVAAPANTVFGPNPAGDVCNAHGRALPP